MNIRGFVTALLAAWCLGAAPLPAGAATEGADWRSAIDRAAQEAAVPPEGVALRSVVVTNIREARTLARWPLSELLESGLAAALAARNPSFRVLGGERQADLGPAGPGRDAALTGTFARTAGNVRVELQLRDLGSGATLAQLAPIVLADAALPARPDPPAGFGRLVLDVEPAAALVFVDGAAVGRGSQTLPVSLGSHVITVAADGFEVFDDAVMVGADRPVALTVRLVRPAAALTIEASVPGARVRVDGEDRGVAPVAIGGLAPGKHKVAVSHDGFKPYEAEIDWGGAKPQKLEAALLPLPGSLVVSADVGEARVELDGVEVGRTPLLVADVAPGTRKLRVWSASRPATEQAVEIRSGRTSHVRAILAAAGGEALAHRAIAVVPRTSAPDDMALAARVAAQLQARHPDVPLADRAQTVRLAQATFLEDKSFRDAALVRRFAQSVKARQVAFVAQGEFKPYQSVLGLVPLRPTLAADLTSFEGGSPVPDTERVVREGGEPWLGSERFPDRQALLDGLAADVADHLAGQPGPRGTAGGEAIASTLSAFLAPQRAGAGLGLLYERRVLDFLEVGAGYAYSNALGADFERGTAVEFIKGNNLVFGVGQNHQLRADALVRFDPPARQGPWFEGARLSPYLGAGVRLNVPRYEVYAENRRDPEDGYYAFEPRGSALLGLKAHAAGLVFRLEAEFPVVVLAAERNPGPTLLVGAGRLF